MKFLIKKIVCLSVMLIIAFCCVSCSGKLESTDLMMMIGDYKVLADEYFFWMLPEKIAMEELDPAYFDNQSRVDSYVDTIEEQIISQYALYEWALDEGYALNEVEIANVETAIEAQILTYGSEDNYKVAMSDMYMTPELNKRLATVGALMNKFLLDAYDNKVPSATVTDEMVNNAISVYKLMGAKHILIVNDDGEDVEANRQLAQQLLDSALAGEDFDILMANYSEDQDLANYTEGYTFGENVMDAEFEAAVKEIEIGEVYGELVETEAGFHIIKRVEPARADIEYMLLTELISMNIENYSESIEVKRTSRLEKLDFDEIVWPKW